MLKNVLIMKVNRSLAILFLTNSLFVFASSLLGPLYAVFVERIGGGLMSISMSTAIYYVVATITLLFVSRVGDSFKETEVLLAGSWLFRGFVFLSLIFVRNIYGLLVVQSALGLGEAVGTPAFSSLFARHLDKGKGMYDYSNWSVVSNIVLALATLIGGFVVSYFGFDLLFGLMFLICVFISFIVLKLPRKEL